MKKSGLLIYLTLILASCQTMPTLQPTGTPIPPTSTPTLTPIPPTSTLTPSLTPEPTLTSDINEKIDNFAAMLGGFLFTENEKIKMVVINGVVDDAAQLNINLSADELKLAHFDERAIIIEDVEKKIISMYGKHGYALFAARCYGNIISVFLLWDAEKLEYKDISQKRAEIKLSASYLNKTIDAAKNIPVDDQLISDGNDIYKNLIDLSASDPLVKGSIDSAATTVSDWSKRLIIYLYPAAYQ